MRMDAEQAVANAYLICKDDSEGQAHQARRQPKALRKSRMPFPEKVECRRDAHRDQHHAADRPYSENQQISHCPVRISNGSQNQQSHSGGTSEPVNYPHD